MSIGLLCISFDEHFVTETDLNLVQHFCIIDLNTLSCELAEPPSDYNNHNCIIMCFSEAVSSLFAGKALQNKYSRCKRTSVVLKGDKRLLDILLTIYRVQTFAASKINVALWLMFIECTHLKVKTLKRYKYLGFET